MKLRSLRRALQMKATAGFTLTELLVALVILSVGILSVGRLFVFAQRHAGHAREESMAVCLAEEIREKILSDNFDDLVTIFDGVDTDNAGTITTPCTDWANHLANGLGGASGRGTIEVMDFTEDPEIVDGMLTVLITISWLESGRSQSLDMRFSTSKVGI